jgi:hypothetical protein
MSVNSNPEDQPTVFADLARNPDLPNQPIVLVSIPGTQNTSSKFVVLNRGAIAGRVTRIGGFQRGLGSRLSQLGIPQRIECIIAIGDNATFDENTTQYIVPDLKNAFAVGPDTHPSALLAASNQPYEPDKLTIELDNIFSDLHEIDISIAGIQNSIDETREATRSILAELKQLDA